MTGYANIHGNGIDPLAPSLSVVNLILGYSPFMYLFLEFFKGHLSVTPNSKKIVDISAIRIGLERS